MNNSIAYPRDPDHEIRIPVDALQEVLEKIFIKKSMFQFDASVAARRILEADLYGVPSHGCARFSRYLEAIDLGDIDPRGRVLSLTDSSAFAVLDGSRAIGHVAATKAAELAVEKAKASGIGAVAVGNSQTLGAAAVYCRLMAKSDVIGLCFSSTGGATINAPGTHAGGVGNSVFSYAVPFGDAEHPLVFDSGCGVQAWGKLELLQRYGIPVPEHILFDADGNETTDLSQAKTMASQGGTFGYGLSLLCSVLAGPLAGGRLPIHKKRKASAEDSQHFFIAIDISRFAHLEKFQEELTTGFQDIRSLPAVESEKPVRLPGDRGSACYADAMENGIPLHRSVAEEIKTYAEKMKIDVTW